MPVVSTSAYDQAEDALNLARSLANDAAGAVFSDTVLMPFLNSAYRALQRPLAEAGVSVLIAQVCLDLPLTNGVTPTSLSDVSSPQLPTDLLAPHQLWEQATGSSDLFTPMEKITGGLPNFQPGCYLRMWEWRTDTIQLIGATQEITVRPALRKISAGPRAGNGSDPDSLLARSARVCSSGHGGSFARLTGARGRYVCLGRSQRERFDRAVCSSGAIQRTPPQALWLSRSRHLSLV
jgi:hypothetical protein